MRYFTGIHAHTISNGGASSVPERGKGTGRGAGFCQWLPFFIIPDRTLHRHKPRQLRCGRGSG